MPEQPTLEEIEATVERLEARLAASPDEATHRLFSTTASSTPISAPISAIRAILP